MRSNVLRWLWGLLPLAAIGWLALTLQRPVIEQDLGERAKAALDQSGAAWAATSFEGRDATLTGQATDETEARAVESKVAAIWGVRQVDNRSTVIEAVANYAWNAQTQGNRLRLQGYVPNDKTRRDIIGIVKGTFPSRDIEDKLVLGRGAPELDRWLGGISFGLKQLARLKPGSQFDLDGTAVTLDGEADDAAAYTAIKQALATGLPQGISLKSDRVTAPVVKPFVWAISRKGPQFEATGFVPDEAARQAAARAIAKLPGASLADSTGIGGGAPAGFSQAVGTLSDVVLKLEGGAAEIRDTAVMVSGMAENDGAAAGLRQDLRIGVPANFKVTDSIQARVTEPKPLSPYVTTAQIDRGSVVLDGAVPSEDQRNMLIGKANARLGGKRVDDRMKVAAGAPDNWLSCVEAGLAGIAVLEPGARAVVTDRTLQISGEAGSEQALSSVPSMVGATPGAGGCGPAINVSLSAAARADIERRKKEADEEAKRRAAAAAVPAPLAPVARSPELDRCQQALTTAVREGVILFERSSSELALESEPTLRRLAELANNCPKARIEIEGHTDDEGGSDRNRRLSEKRAQAVVDFLVQQGVETSRLSAVGYGEERPVVPNDTVANRAKNRRIEFTVKPD